MMSIYLYILEYLFYNFKRTAMPYIVLYIICMFMILSHRYRSGDHSRHLRLLFMISIISAEWAVICIFVCMLLIIMMFICYLIPLTNPG